MSIPMSRPSLSLKGKVAIVTGGGTGIGQAIALEFAKAGADVVVGSRRLPNLEKVADEVRTLGRRCLAVQTDIAKKADVANLVQRTMDEFGSIDILVNNAAIGSITGKKSPWLIDFPEDHWHQIIDINLNGIYLCCQAVGKGMVERKKGIIINISSVAAFHGGAHPYNISKAGVVRLTAGLAQDLGPYNIRVNAIAPGWVRTNVGVVLIEEEFETFSDPKTAANISLGRIAEPSDVAIVALFLASDASNYITGQTIVMDGGGRVT